MIQESNKDGTVAETAQHNTIVEVFLEELKDIYGAEKQLMQALPVLIEAADSQELKSAFSKHLEQTKEHALRLERIFSMLGENREAKKCKAMEGLIQEGKDIIAHFEKGAVRDCALIIGAQKVEHYEIAAYGSLCELAEVIGKHKAADLLDTTLEEEEETDKLLTSIAETVNDCAMSGKPISNSGASAKEESDQKQTTEQENKSTRIAKTTKTTSGVSA